MKLLLKLLITLFGKAIELWLISLLRLFEKRAIIELGYRSSGMKYKDPYAKKPLWDRVLFWSLTKNSKTKNPFVWLYFSFNLLELSVTVGSLIYTCVLLAVAGVKELLLYQLTYIVSISAMWALLHHFPDLCLLPTIQKKYGIKTNKRGRGDGSSAPSEESEETGK